MGLGFAVLLNAVKVALSPEARSSASDLLHLLNKSPEWKRDICKVEARISASNKERALLIRDILLSKLQSLAYGSDALQAFATAFDEITSNAFKHGTDKRRFRRSRPITISADVTRSYVAVTVYNASPKHIHLDGLLRNAAIALRSDSYAPSGRGLLLTHSLVDELIHATPNGIKFVVNKERVNLRCDIVDTIHVVSILSGHSNPSIAARILELLAKNNPHKLVLDLTGTGVQELSKLGDVLASVSSRSAIQAQTRPVIEGQSTEEIIFDLLAATTEEHRRAIAVAAQDILTRESSRLHLPPSTRLGEIVPRFKSRNGCWRIVSDNDELFNLLPGRICHKSVDEALNALLLQQ